MYDRLPKFAYILWENGNGIDLGEHVAPLARVEEQARKLANQHGNPVSIHVQDEKIPNRWVRIATVQPTQGAKKPSADGLTVRTVLTTESVREARARAKTEAAKDPMRYFVGEFLDTSEATLKAWGEGAVIITWNRERPDGETRWAVVYRVLVVEEKGEES